MRDIGRRALAIREPPSRGDAHGIDPTPEFGGRVVTACPFGLVGQQQLKHHLARLLCPLRGGLYLHAGSSLALTGRGQHALALDLDHASAAIAIGAVTGGGMPAQVRDVGAMALGDLPNGLARGGFDWLAVELERDLCCPAHGRHALRVRAGSTNRRQATKRVRGVRTSPGAQTPFGCRPRRPSQRSLPL